MIVGVTYCVPVTLKEHFLFSEGKKRANICYSLQRKKSFTVYLTVIARFCRKITVFYEHSMVS